MGGTARLAPRPASTGGRGRPGRWCSAWWPSTDHERKVTGARLHWTHAVPSSARPGTRTETVPRTCTTSRETCGASFLFRRDAPAHPATMIKGTPEARLGGSVAVSGGLLVLGTAYGAVVLRVSGRGARALCRLEVNGPFDGYGASVAVDGQLVVVGSPAGFTVYQVEDDECVPRGEFKSAGASVAIAGRWIAAGQPRFDGSAKWTGRVGVFEVENDAVRHRFWLLPSRPVPGACFGDAVAISKDTVFGGAPGVEGRAFVAAARLP
jgi:hypothetical protein